jgi:hypothetical protein
MVLVMSCLAGLVRADSQYVCDVEAVAFPPMVSPADSLVEARLVFISFPGITDALPAWAESLEAQLPRYIETMSRGAQRMNLQILRRPVDQPRRGWRRWTRIS